ncbi:NYN domain-containing protein [Lachnoclostridium sp. Marseille-P6806]|uniref:NYN domain-containing protein n=1 Tax=Lachnoclostridium sp. Marseille-P6806 TaxID=2364793 RepID=UPI0010308ECD|nr:NYN domain-containing protein [Lachnoclostridium sp. Marseille-P6806]
MKKTAILVDGGFYRRRAAFLWGKKDPEDRAKELCAYCFDHLKHEKKYDPERCLYRIFYYDCPPIDKTVYHPFLKKGIDLRHSEVHKWTLAFFEQLKHQRKVALRMGVLSEEFATYMITPSALRALCDGKKVLSDLSDQDFNITVQQKGVDMKIGLDISSLAYKKQVDQIILIAGDSDFVPAAKLARREGIDFILDPMWADIKADLFEHIDGLRSEWEKNRSHGKTSDHSSQKSTP